MRLPILGMVILVLGGCATRTIVEIPPLPEPTIPEFTRLTAETPCIEWRDDNFCLAWKLSREAYEQLVRRDAEKSAVIDGLLGIIKAHNEQAN